MNNSLIEKVTTLIQAPINQLGFEIVQIALKSDNKNKILEILIERLDAEPISIADCSLVSKNISVILDVEEVIEEKYNLEVSSAGLERPLVKIQDYKKFLDHEIKIKLNQPLDGKRVYCGKIVRVIDNDIYLICDHKEIMINFDLIKNARLILTDEIFKKILNKKNNLN